MQAKLTPKKKPRQPANGFSFDSIAAYTAILEQINPSKPRSGDRSPVVIPFDLSPLRGFFIPQMFQY